MQEKTLLDRLMKHTVDDLQDAALRIGVEPTEENMRKVALAELLAKAVPERKMDIILRMRESEYMALSSKVQAEEAITIAKARLDEPLENALVILEQYGLAWRTTSHWQLSSDAQKMMLPSMELKEDLVFHDIISDMLEGWLLHVGMMPLETLLDKVTNVPGVDGNSITCLREQAFALLVGRNGFEVIYVDEGTGTLWATSPDLEDPGKLHARVTSPTVAPLPYPILTRETLLGCVRGECLPGDKKAYQSLAEWIIINRPRVSEQECRDIMDTAAYMLQNGEFDEMVYFLMDTVEPKGEKNIREGEEAITCFVNHIPLWENKGHSASEMHRILIASAKQKMPGRNDPCTCGSGKKYKQCCGRRMN